MGVAGSGKSTVAARLAARLSVRFIEADDFHTAPNIEKMAAGVPLTDDDRWPWLAALRQAMRREERVVVACSALKRAYRDTLRSAGHVRFLDLQVDRDEITRRLARRTDHFMAVSMVASQFEALETPDADEPDVARVDGTGTVDEVVSAAETGLTALSAGTRITPLCCVGGTDRSITDDELRALVNEVARDEVIARGVRRVLLVPPDHTRLRSRAGEITGILFEILRAAECEVVVLPALGTHAPMAPSDVGELFRGKIPANAVVDHRWRQGLTRLGEISAAEVSAVSDGRMAQPIPIDMNELVFAGWDLVVSVGQVVPHEVIGMANYTKNLVIGLGGAPTINGSHFLGALCDMETIMGRSHGPVRDVVDAAFDRFLAGRVPVLWILTVVQDTPDGVVHRGFFVGRGGSAVSGGAAYRAAADLSTRCNIEVASNPIARVACWLDPGEFNTTWLANKAVYRTRMTLADGGELIVLGPGIRGFGEDLVVDALIRRYGYRGKEAVLSALETDPDLAANLGAAAHLIHGSSEDRFRIVYCTDPADGGLTRDEIEGVGYEWRHLGNELERLGVGATTATGPRRDRDGGTFAHIASPALGLWVSSTRFP